MFLLFDVCNNDSYVMSDMGSAEELALIDKTITLSTRSPKELQTPKRVFLVFFNNAIISPDSAFYQCEQARA